ncbi:hypothetical protein [Oceanobacillus kimchii]|uniref:Uncharacterized protein n=1 Tax=Oceanobacillus kimchii TaxID=746691 RepID=A0ABQ5THU8_9BACI|nr:hypothetical protein [Oceanobacillus kimchii]GLO65692.1 hypothetical protein MACH08_14760 [Oceanobacillus kimchii]
MKSNIYGCNSFDLFAIAIAVIYIYFLFFRFFYLLIYLDEDERYTNFEVWSVM